MALKDELKALVVSFDEATNKIAARIDALLARIPAEGGLTAADATELRDSLTAEVARLTSLGSDPSNPVPAEV